MKDMNDQEFLAEVRRILMMGGDERGLHRRLWDTARGWADWSDGILPRTGGVVGGGGAAPGSVSQGFAAGGPGNCDMLVTTVHLTDAATIKAERDELRRVLADIVRYDEDTEWAESKDREALDATDGNVGAREAMIHTASALLSRVKP